MALTFKKHQFANGLRLIVHENNNTPMATFHVTYNVGARCENPERTGLAHLLEHYMFCGSINVPKYDEPLQKIGRRGAKQCRHLRTKPCNPSLHRSQAE